MNIIDSIVGVKYLDRPIDACATWINNKILGPKRQIDHDTLKVALKIIFNVGLVLAAGVTALACAFSFKAVLLISLFTLGLVALGVFTKNAAQRQAQEARKGDQSSVPAPSAT